MSTRCRVDRYAPQAIPAADASARTTLGYALVAAGLVVATLLPGAVLVAAVRLLELTR